MGRRRWLVLGVAVVLLAAGLAWWLWPSDPAPVTQVAPPPAPTTSTAPTGPCDTAAARPFVPSSLEVTGVRSVVQPVPRDSAGIMGVLPEGDKTMFATDLGGVKAGAAHGRLLLNTHTWPDGSAMGNRLLARLQVGDRLVVRGQGGVACYRVARRDQVLASVGYPGWDRSTGKPGAVIVVCSGTRLGPENWTHRTLWFLTPYLAGSDAA